MLVFQICLVAFHIYFHFFNKVSRLTAPGLGTGTSPVYITHLTWDVSTATGVLNLPSLKISRMSDTRYAHTADTWDKPLENTKHI